MKKISTMILAAVLLLSLAACGSSEPEYVAPTAPAQETEATLSPREQFEQQKEAMDNLLNGNTDSGKDATAVTYTTNGITYTLDSTFTSGNEAADASQHKYTSDTFWFTEQIAANNFGVYTSKELAEKIAAQDSGRTVGSANGVYYVEDAARGTIKAYYVDNSGYYWILYGFVTGGNDYAANRDQLIAFCTSGKLN